MNKDDESSYHKKMHRIKRDTLIDELTIPAISFILLSILSLLFK